MGSQVWQLAEATMIDAGIEDNNPNTNYATGVYLPVGNDTSSHKGRSLLKWPALSDHSIIPIAAIIDAATIKKWCLNNYGGTTRTQRIFRLKRAWVESEVSWNSWKAGSSWSTAGAFGAADCEQTDIGSVSVPGTIASPTALEMSLSVAAIQEITRGTWTDNGFLLKADTENNDQVRWRSSSDATSGYRIQLTVSWHMPGGRITIY